MLAMTLTDPRHIAQAPVSSGAILSKMGKAIGADMVTQSGSFEEIMLRTLDDVSGQQQNAEQLIQAAITDPDSVDIHDITIAQAKASMSLNITKTVLNRLVQGWKDIINTR
ncbi:MAG: flagellar hook-basal body complex protein FliE [Spirochaetaceae bacterium]|jgi:flagellar hook-basal body complex protein FliE|nr:flagellar hook-basal body complex protein FliE [Spirochaetaceae bacterium]